MKTTYHHLPPFLTNSNEFVSETVKYFLTRNILLNIGDADLISACTPLEYESLPKALIESDLYNKAVSSKSISDVVATMQRSYTYCDLNIGQLGGTICCRITMGAIRLSLNFDVQKFINISTAQSLDVEQARQITETATIHAYSIMYGYLSFGSGSRIVVKDAKYYEIICLALNKYNLDVISDLCVLKSNISNAAIVALFYYQIGIPAFIRFECSNIDLPQISPHIPNAAELPRDPKNALERFIVGLK